MSVCIKVVWRNGLEPEGTANVVGQWWKPLEPDLALLVDAAQRDGVGHVWQGHMHLGDPRCDQHPLVPREIHDAVAGVNRDFLPRE